MPDPLLFLEAQVNRVFFALRNRFKFTRHGYIETPCQNLKNVSPDVLRKVSALKDKYHVNFEAQFDQANALENYHLLDLLDQAKTRIGFSVPNNQTLIDVGSKNFYYVAALQSFFKPKELTGIEIDAYKLYQNFHTRLSYAQSYIRRYPNTQFLAQNFLDHTGHAQGLTWFLPFVVPYPLIKWTLPMSTFQPQKLFAKAYEILEPNGWLFMVNQGEAEKEQAYRLAQDAGFRLKSGFAHKDSLLTRNITPFASYWKK